MKESFSDKFFENLHTFEFERRDHSESTDGFLLAVLSVLGSVGIYYSKIMPRELGVWNGIFGVLSVTFGILIGRAAYCMARSVRPRTIAYLSQPSEIRAFVEGLRVHFGFDWNEEEKLNEAIDTDLRAFARTQYIKCADENRTAFQQKLAWQTRTRVAVSWAIIVLLVNAVPTFVVQNYYTETQHVHVLSLPEDKTTGDQDGKRTTETQSTQADDAAPKAASTGDPASAGRPAPQEIEPRGD